MSGYSAGDVVLAFIDFGRGNGGKIRPALITGKTAKGCYNAYPVTGREPDGQPYIPVGLADFEYGGLDMFEDSYILVSIPVEIRRNLIKGKKGRLSRILLEKVPIWGGMAP